MLAQIAQERLPEPLRHLENQNAWTTLPNPLLGHLLRLEASHLAKLVFLVLYSRARMRHPEVGTKAISELFQVSPRTTRRALEELARLGLAERGEHGWRALVPDLRAAGPQEPQDEGEDTRVRRADSGVRGADKSVHIEDKEEGKGEKKDLPPSSSSSFSLKEEAGDPPPLPFSQPQEEEELTPKKGEETPEERTNQPREREPLPRPSTRGGDHRGEEKPSPPQLWTRVRSALGEPLWKELCSEVGRHLEGRPWFRLLGRLASALEQDGEEVFREGVRRALEAVALGAAKNPAQYLIAVVEDRDERWKPAFRSRLPSPDPDPRLRELEEAVFLVPASRWGQNAKSAVQARYAGRASPDGSRVFLEAGGVSRIFSLEEAVGFMVRGEEVVL